MIFSGLAFCVVVYLTYQHFVDTIAAHRREMDEKIESLEADVKDLKESLSELVGEEEVA